MLAARVAQRASRTLRLAARAVTTAGAGGAECGLKSRHAWAVCGLAAAAAAGAWKPAQAESVARTSTSRCVLASGHTLFVAPSENYGCSVSRSFSAVKGSRHAWLSWRCLRFPPRALVLADCAVALTFAWPLHLLRGVEYVCYDADGQQARRLPSRTFL
jgi:hypothetical protein